MARAANRQRQRGSMAVTMLLLMVWLLGALVVVEVAYLYWAKRDTQKVADLSALAGAQQLQDCASSNADNSAARGNATTENHFTGTVAINCGNWNPTSGPSPTYFTAAAAGATTNAVMVTAKRPVTPFFPFTAKLPSVQTEAVATQAPSVAVFTVGTTLVGVSGSGTLQQLLAGIGLPLSGSSLVGYNGLADVNVTPSGLLKQLGIPVDTTTDVGTLNTLLASKTVALGDLLNAIVTVAGQQQLLSANASLLSAITAALATNGSTGVTLSVPLGSTATSNGLFAQIVGPNGITGSALSADVNALQLLATAIGVATGQHAVTANTSLNLGLVNLTAALSVIEPPSVGIGGIGTTAYTSQIRAFIEIATPGTVSLLGGLVKLSLDIPIVVNLTNAKATLTDLCDPPSATPATASIAVTSSVLEACVGNYTAANAFSTALNCGSPPAKQLFAISLAGTNLASLNTSFHVNALDGNGSVTLSPGTSATTGDTLDLGTSVSNLVNAITVGLFANQSTAQGSSLSNSATTLQTATDIWNNTTGSSNLAHLQNALTQLQTTTTGLNGLLGSVSNDVLGLLGNTVTLNVTGLLGDVGSLLGTVTNTLGGVVTGTTCALGFTSTCIANIQGALSASNPGGTGAGEFLGLLSYLLSVLQAPLNDIGTSVLQPVITKTLGLEIGENTVQLNSLECHRVQLVY